MTTRPVRNLSCIFLCGVAYMLLIIVFINSDSSKHQRALKFEYRDSVLGQVHKKTPLHPIIVSSNARSNNVKYILLGVGCYAAGVLRLVGIDREGQNIFIENKCKYINCFFTYNSKHLKDPSDFDAIVFSGLTLKNVQRQPFENRSIKQKYVFGMTEPNSLFPAINPLFDDFFNWTWTYRLESDLTWTYFKIYDLKGNVIGPAADMKWPKSLKPIDEELKRKLRSKTKAVIWFVSHCKTQSRRERFVEEFNVEFQKYGFSVDEVGKCGQLTCNESKSCLKMVENNYHFYLAFENTLDVDYVTEKVLNALNNFVVPVVYGGANYSRFLPPGSHLNARELGPKNLAKAINDAMRNSTLYHEFFRWRNHFRFESSVTTSELCNICTALNDEEKMKTSVVTNFRSWWNTPTRQRTYEFLLKTFLLDKNLQHLAMESISKSVSSFDMWKYIRNLSSIPRESSNSEFNLHS